MLYHAKSSTIRIDDTDMDYVSFGIGQKTLVLLPGLSDGLATVKGKAMALATSYKIFAQEYTVYVFSRKNRLPEGCTTRDMAADLAKAMTLLGIRSADLMGISQGGMIAQYIAIDHPELIDRLVLAVTLSKQNTIAQQTLGQWTDMARRGDYRSMMIDTVEKSYSPAKIKKYRRLYPLIGRIGKPKGFSRFLIQANACLTHCAFGELEKIKCPTLVVGGLCDKIVGPDASKEMAARIPDCELYMYDGLGHAAYEEAKDFNSRILTFFNA